MNEQSAMAYRAAVAALAGCAATTARLVLRRRLRLPADQVGRRVRFADGTSARGFRETVVDRGATRDPCALAAEFGPLGPSQVPAATTQDPAAWCRPAGVS